MKQLLILFLGGVLFTSCNNQGSSADDTAKDTTTAANSDAQKMDYPYTIDHPDNWEIGNQQNTLNVLKSLKAWENNKMDEAAKYFGDSVHVRFDGIDKKISNDSLKAFITPDATAKSWSIKMQDWESVISKDKKEEYVTVWYREFHENIKGKKDSIDVINDIKMKDGKIIELDQYVRKLH
jgi:hypothetical protein